MRTTGSTARKALAGLLLGIVMTLSMGGIAAAQSSGSSQSNQGSGGSSSSTTRSSVSAGSTARTGAEMWIPLLIGGGVITIAVATRIGLSRAAGRT